MVTLPPGGSRKPPRDPVLVRLFARTGLSYEAGVAQLAAKLAAMLDGVAAEKAAAARSQSEQSRKRGK